MKICSETIVELFLAQDERGGHKRRRVKKKEGFLSIPPTNGDNREGSAESSLSRFFLNPLQAMTHRFSSCTFCF